MVPIMDPSDEETEALFFPEEPPKPVRLSTLPPPGVAPGTILDGTYELLQPLGEGAMGVVFLARDRRLERNVAVKFIQPEMVSSADALDRFVREARAMARVKHVNVVEIYAFGEFAKSPYFIMEYVPGTTVEDWLHKRAKLLSVDEAIGILDQVSRGVEAIHEVGAIHRDLKPTNVLIGPAFRICVADLGLVKVFDKPLHDEDKDTVTGTPAYMAPEVVLGTPPSSNEIEQRVDVYALGVMAFELLTGRLPFEHDDPTEMMLAHVDVVPAPPSELRADLPPSFDDVVLDALAKDPMTRIPTARAFRRALLAARSAAVQPTRGVRIVVADDDDDFLDLVNETLRSAFEGAEIVQHKDGKSALAAVDASSTSLVVVDLDLPVLNGVELTAAIRASANGKNVPILVVTATGGAPDWRLLQALGADGFLVKPIDPVGLIALTRRILDPSK